MLPFATQPLAELPVAMQVLPAVDPLMVQVDAAVEPDWQSSAVTVGELPVVQSPAPVATEPL